MSETAAAQRKDAIKDIPFLLTPAEVAEVLRINLCTVYDWIKSGVLPAVKIGQIRRIPRPFIEQLIPSKQTRS